MHLVLTKTAAKHLRKLPAFFRNKIETKIEALKQNPFPLGIKKLTGRPGYRFRIGDYRLMYDVNKKRKIITILRTQHRKDAYR